ncbi:MAG: DNA translocase FtsK [Anaerolineae bacterium]|nr:DNA translocase FtsK [Anaerolineae bacterium]
MTSARPQPTPRPVRTPRPPNPNSFGNRLRRFLEDPDAFRNLGQTMPSWADELGAILLIIVGIFVFTALLNPVGDAAVATSLATGLKQAFGVGAFVTALTIFGMGILLLLPKINIHLNLKFDWMRILAVEIAFISLQGLFHLLAFEEEGRALAREGKGGGYVGWAISSILTTVLGQYLSIIVLTIGMAYSLMLALHIRRHHIRQSLEWVGTRSQDLSMRVRPAIPQRPAVQPNGDITTQERMIGASVVASAVATMAHPISVQEMPVYTPQANIPSAGVKVEVPYGNYARPDVTPAPVPPTPPPLPPQVLPGIQNPDPVPTRAERPARPTRPEPMGRSVPPPLPLAALPQTTVEEQPAEIQSPAVPIPEVEAERLSIETVSSVADEAVTAVNLENEIEDMQDDENEMLPRRNTLVINGQVVNLPVKENGEAVKPRSSNSNPINGNGGNGRRYFTVDGFQDRRMVGQRPVELPPFELLHYTHLRLPSEDEVNNNARIIEHTMMEFDVDADVIDVRVGPTVTQYAVSPIKEVINDAGERVVIRTRVGKIAALQNDLALALSARSVRIEAPVPGHSYVGIEVPNREPSVVDLRSVLESEASYKERHKPLAVPLGRDVSGDPIVADLASMPHMLIAGTTGSGKSVCLTAMIASLVANNTPDRLRLIILDPKMVEMVHFNGLPHLLGPVETDGERIIGVLRWSTREMDRRYKLLEHENARHLEAYNKTVVKKGKPEEQLPYIVIVIDEIGDLMMTRPDETEKTVTRLAQKARAAGMHLVIATQRPSVDVITGLIKANFPARISFAVASGTDSRVILDTVGAESLVGKGDMLFLAPDAAGPKRIQGCYVSDEELYEIVMYWKAWHTEQQEVQEAEEETVPPWERGMTRLETLSELDPMLEEALSLVVLDGEASASLIQRRLGIGYPRAARLMDSLHELGIIGEPLAGGRSRRVLVKSIDEARRMVRNNRRKPPGSES